MVILKTKREEWLYAWIRNNNNVLDAGHPYANDLYQQWGEAKMNLFAGLKDDGDALLYYVDNSSQFAPAAVTEVSAGDGEVGGISKEFEQVPTFYRSRSFASCVDSCACSDLLNELNSKDRPANSSLCSDLEEQAHICSACSSLALCWG